MVLRIVKNLFLKQEDRCRVPKREEININNIILNSEHLGVVLV